MLERHQLIAALIALGATALVWLRDGTEQALAAGTVLLILWLPIVFYRALAWLAGFGFPEIFARDYGSENHPGPYALFFWILFLLAALFILFDWRLY